MQFSGSPSPCGWVGEGSMGSAGSMVSVVTRPHWVTRQGQVASNLSLSELLGVEKNAVRPQLPPSSRLDLTDHQIRIVLGTSGNLWTDLGVYSLVLACSGMLQHRMPEQ